MSKVIRRGMFETNSSSCHSITICGGDYVIDSLPVDKAGVCKIFPGEFGWEVEDFDHASAKASYCLTYLKTGFKEDRQEQLGAMLKSVIKCAVPETKEVEFVSHDEYYPWGYIDHQSHVGEGDACGEAFESEKALSDFIFNRASILHTDNDNRH